VCLLVEAKTVSIISAIFAEAFSRNMIHKILT
jgi:hypothetical protein